MKKALQRCSRSLKSLERYLTKALEDEWGGVEVLKVVKDCRKGILIQLKEDLEELTGDNDAH